jgi:threonine synthase
VQAEGAKPVFEAFRSGKDAVPAGARTLADSIAVGTPRNWLRAIRGIRESGGEMVTVTDEEILDAMRLAARLAGVFGEPAGIAAVAGVKIALQENIVKSNESVAVVMTGNGLKDISSARQAAGTEHLIDPTLDALAETLSVPAGKGG